MGRLTIKMHIHLFKLACHKATEKEWLITSSSRSSRAFKLLDIQEFYKHMEYSSRASCKSTTTVLRVRRVCLFALFPTNYDKLIKKPSQSAKNVRLSLILPR